MNMFDVSSAPDSLSSHGHWFFLSELQPSSGGTLEAGL